MKHLRKFNELEDIIFVRTNKFDNTGNINKLPYSGIHCFAINKVDFDKYVAELELWGGKMSDIEILDSTNLTPYSLDYNKCHKFVTGDTKEIPQLEEFNSVKHVMKFHKQSEKSMIEWISDLGLGKGCYQVILSRK